MQLDDRLAFTSTCCLFGVSVLATAAVFLTRWRVVPSTTEKVGVGVYVLAVGLLIGLSYARRSSRGWVLLVALTSLSAGTAFGVVEVVLSTVPSLLPDSVLVHNPYLLLKARGVRPDEVRDVLEHLSDSPWVKFRPNVKVRSMGYRGDDFSAEWTTDELGFKNEPRVAALRKVTAIALGDSFVEAMGVVPSRQWTTLVSNAGYPVYSFGVQGYAPQQMVGVLRRYGPLFQSEFVLFGFTPGFEERSLRFADPAKIVATRQYEGGIEAVNQYLKEVRNVEYRIFPATNALLSAARTGAGVILRNGIKGRLGGAMDSISRYRNGVEQAAAVSFDPLSSGWTQTLDAILEARDMSRGRGARLAVLLFTQRAFSYYEKIEGVPPPASHYEVRLARALEEFCRVNEIVFVDTHKAFQDYVNKVWPSVRELPFFDIDGHPNEIGQALITNRVVGLFEAGNSRPRSR